jgi:Tfp pilus assembly protein PilX
MPSDKSMIKQNGFVSIIAATVLMVLVTLVSIGFLTLMQREQRQALDRQLSSQAFYAAETAINDTYKEIKLAEDAGSPLPDEKNECDVSGPLWNDGVINNSEDNGTVVSYTCLQYDQTPNNIIFTDTITTQSSKVFTVEPAAGVPLEDIKITWNGANGNSAAYGVTRNNTNLNLPVSMGTDQIPILRIDIIPAPTGGFSRETLIAGTGTYYLYPTRSGNINTFSYGPDNTGPENSGTIINVTCSGNDPDNCELTIDNLEGPDRYYLRVKSIYQNVKTLDIEGNGGDVEFKNAQILVDATGKANDVLRRIDVRLSDINPAVWPEAVVEASDGICKLLTVIPRASPVVDNADCY